MTLDELEGAINALQERSRFADIRLEENGPTGLDLAQQAVTIHPKLKVLPEFETESRREVTLNSARCA